MQREPLAVLGASGAQPGAFDTLGSPFGRAVSVSNNLFFLKNDEIPYLAPSDEGAVSEAD